MKKTFLAILLSICMLVGLLPATVFASGEVDGFKMTLEYDTAACSVVVKDRSDNNAEVVSGQYLKKNSWGEVCAEIRVNVNDGYRIKKVTVTEARRTRDFTEDFIIGVFGWKPMLYANSDFTLKIETEAVPVLPTVTSIQLYLDEACTIPLVAGGNLTVTEDSDTYVYVKAMYSDGKEYPSYTARGFMEYTVDGTTWQTTSFGGYYHYFPVKESQNKDMWDDTTAQANYDFRIRIEPDDMYCTGDIFYSEVYHVNRGVDGTATNFTDVASGAYYYDAVSWAVDKGITNGYGSESTFCPDIECTRGQVVTFLWRAAGSPEPTSLNNPFTDVASNAYYYKAVLWAVENGITAGYGSDTIFNPDGVCNRAQVATFMWRAAGKPSMAGAENKFTDVVSGAYYYDAVLWAVENGITNGYGSDTIFNPDGNCTRGQIVTFLYRGI